MYCSLVIGNGKHTEFGQKDYKAKSLTHPKGKLPICR